MIDIDAPGWRQYLDLVSRYVPYSMVRKSRLTTAGRRLQRTIAYMVRLGDWIRENCLTADPMVGYAEIRYILGYCEGAEQRGYTPTVIRYGHIKAQHRWIMALSILREDLQVIEGLLREGMEGPWDQSTELLG